MASKTRRKPRRTPDDLMAEIRARKQPQPGKTTGKAPARAMSEPHAFALLFPLVKGEEFKALVASIKARGFLSQFPIATYQGKVLDGWSRCRAAKEAGVAPVYKEFEGDDAAALAFVCAANALRRHLTNEQKREVVAGVLKQNPKLSNNAVAKMVGVSDKTVGAVRKRLESTSEIPKSKTRIGKDGRERPAKRKAATKRKQPAPKPAPTEPDPELTAPHWQDLSPEKQRFWERWMGVEQLTQSPVKAEALSAAAKSASMLEAQGLTRKDIPDRWIRWMKYLGIPLVHGQPIGDAARAEPDGKVQDLADDLVNLVMMTPDLTLPDALVAIDTARALVIEHYRGNDEPTDPTDPPTGPAHPPEPAPATEGFPEMPADLERRAK